MSGARRTPATGHTANRSAGTRPAPIPDHGLLASRLTERDRKLCQLVWEHRVLTSRQCAELVFASPITARHRLVVLSGLRVLDRFRPPWSRGEGSAPWHYVLGPAGAAVLAAEQGVTVGQLGWRRDRALGIAHSQHLAHQVGVNGFFAALAGHARRRADAALVAWWPERRCAERWGQAVRPDGYGRWRQGGGEVDFFLEYDRATEDLGRLLGKLEGYGELAAASGIATPVLFWLPGAAREAAVRAAIGQPPVPVATATPGAGGGHPAGPVWLPARGGARRLLVDLARP